MIRIMARISSRPQAEIQLRQILRDLVDPSRKEAACISYELFQNEENPIEFVTMEQWADQAGAEAHSTTPHVADAIAKAGNLLAQPPLIQRFKQLA